MKSLNVNQIFSFDNKLYIAENKCEKCENINICKWCEEMKNTREHVEKIPKVRDLSPIKIKVICDSFRSKKEIQHGRTYY